MIFGTSLTSSTGCGWVCSGLMVVLSGSFFSVNTETGSSETLIADCYVALLIYLFSCLRAAEVCGGFAFLSLGFGVLDLTGALLLPALVGLRAFLPVPGLSNTLVVNFEVFDDFEAAGLPAFASLEGRICCERDSSLPFSNG